MSVIIIRNDDDFEELYNRTTVFYYTKIQRTDLCNYVRELELLADDRQKFFFKIDLTIFTAPSSMVELKDWYILSIVLKARKPPTSFAILVKLFYEKLPFKLMVDFSSTNLFICSGTNSNDSKPLSGNEHAEFIKLSTYHKIYINTVIKVTEKFEKQVHTSEDAPKVLVELARQYNLKGGNWILFFNGFDMSQSETVFDLFLAEVNKNWGTIKRFNAKISVNKMIICIGNESTGCVTDPTLLVSDTKKSVENDPEPLEIKKIIDDIYGRHSTTLGHMEIRYKPDIISACCIQRDNVIRPTVYAENYGVCNDFGDFGNF